MHSVKVVILDFDGVLLDSKKFHYQAIQQFSGACLSEEDFARMHDGNFFGHTVPTLQNVDWNGYRDFVFLEQVKCSLQDECRRFLESVSRKFPLFIVTSGGQRNISMLLENNGVRALFQEILGFEAGLAKAEKFGSILLRHALRAEEVIFITDTLGDILEAHDVGIRTIAVDFGFHDRSRLESGNPYRIVSRFREISDILGL